MSTEKDIQTAMARADSPATTGSAIERAHFLQAEIRRAKAERSEHNSAAAALTNRIGLLEEWEKEISPLICSTCNGHGRLREWVAQDESHLVVCDKCKGTGSPNDPS